jgi:hypothetical protein
MSIPPISRHTAGGDPDRPRAVTEVTQPDFL